MYQVPLDVYEQLKGATPEGKRDIVLSLIEEHPDHRLELPERDGMRADLSRVDLSRAALQEIVDARAGATPRWWHARLQGVKLYDANLQGAFLRYAELQGVDLSMSEMRHCYLVGAWLDRTRLRPEQIEEGVGEERDGDWTGAKLAYLGLKGSFDGLGDYAAASWAYRRERRMEKREALEKAHAAHRRHDWKGELRWYAKVLTDQMVELVCDYGEGIGRVLGCLALLWLGCALIYGLLGHVLADRGARSCTTHQVIDLLSFSLATMVTLEAPGLLAYESLAMRILMPLEAALGIFFLGLLGFVAGNRIRRS